MGRFIAILLFSVVLGIRAEAQCYIKSTDQSSGHITYYLDPELIAQTDQFGMAMSVQMVGNKYYLTATYQFAGVAQPVEEKIALNLKNGYTIELDMYTMEVGTAAGVELCMAVFYLNADQMKFLKGSNLHSVDFRTQDGEQHKLPVSSNPDVLVRQLKCFGR